MNELISSYKQKIRGFLDSQADCVSFYWKARVGLYALLQAMDVKEGDEVIMPAYTCVVVPNSVLYLGARPVYVDVSSDTYNMDVGKVADVISERTKVVICQNTYGLSSDLGDLNKIAKKHGLYTIEDCTHGFGGTYEGIPNGLSCDAAIYSTQWNKPFSTGVGGFSVTSNKEIAGRLAEVDRELVSPTALDLINLKTLYFVRRFLLNDFTYWPMVRFYRWLSSRNIVLGSSSGEEVDSIAMPKGYFKGFSKTQAKEGLRAFKKLSLDLAVRKETARSYTELLAELGKKHIGESFFQNHSFLKYPVLVEKRDEFLRLAEKSRIELGDWFTSPLHPVSGDLTAWEFDRAKFPVAGFLSDHVVNLPTTPADIKRVISFLKRYREHIM